ncbi:hypothetical protein BKI52_13010 [marine bacterium AO1-C]|nr:hypothetical protein BKI52_13010 [marine bacterium AO1-C]
MTYTTITKWTLRIISLIFFTGIVSYLFISSQVKQHNGSNTTIVDPSIIKTTSSPLAITNVSVLSIDCSKMLEGVTVLVEDGKILDIAKNLSLTNNYTKIDGTGKYLIPGLIDTHVHLTNSKNDLLLYLANGVTSIAEMFGNNTHLQWRKDAQNGALSPKIYVATRKLASRKGTMRKIRSWFGSEKSYTTIEKARAAVRAYKAQGYDAIKLSSFLNPGIYQAIVDEAQKQKIPTIGHLSLEVGLNKLYTSGQSQLAHVEEIVKNTMEDFGGLNYKNTKAYLDYLRQNSDAIAIKLRKNNITVSSTIWLVESFPKQKFNLENFIKTIPLEYANPGLVEGSSFLKGWLPGNNAYENLEIRNDPERSKKSRMYWNTYVKAHQIMTRALIKHRVRIVAGTDANTACAVPGFSLHDELESLHKAGLTNAQVLRAATLHAAQWMQNGSTGRIESGCSADMILLNKNPLKDIRNTKTIQAVIANGKFLNKKALDKILRSIKEANNRSRKVKINPYIQ